MSTASAGCAAIWRVGFYPKMGLTVIIWPADIIFIHILSPISVLRQTLLIRVESRKGRTRKIFEPNCRKVNVQKPESIAFGLLLLLENTVRV